MGGLRPDLRHAGGHARQLGASPETRLEIEGGIKGALRTLATPQDDDSESDATQPPKSDKDEQAKAQKELEKKKKELAREERRIEKEKRKLNKELRQFDKLEEREEELERLQNEIEERSEKIEKDYREALAAVYAKHGIEEPPDFVDIPGWAWREAFDEAKDQRVINAGKQLEKMTGWPEWMGEYLPGEAAEALIDMPYGDNVTEALYYIIDWLSRTVGEVEAKRGEVND